MNCGNTLDAWNETATLSLPIFALIVYRLGQEILNLQSGVRFPVGALYSFPFSKWRKVRSRATVGVYRKKVSAIEVMS